MGAVRDLNRNCEVVAGVGQQCFPGDAGRCGDGGAAVDARLIYPKGGDGWGKKGGGREKKGGWSERGKNGEKSGEKMRDGGIGGEIL